ncbi:hypothetical protein SDJN02_23291, partial [Cucurbita argyrosperma subsp. argyrosperma]
MESSVLPITAILFMILINQSYPVTTQPINDTDLCLSSLSADAFTIHGSHRLMTIAALTVALTHTHDASSTVTSLAKANAITTRESYTLSDCIEEFGDSVEELKMAVEALKGNDKTRLDTEDIQTWVSAALTDDNTCMDGFARDTMNGSVKESVKAMVVDVAQLTSIALSLVRQLT